MDYLYFRDADGNKYGYPVEVSRDFIEKKGLIELTSSEVEDLLNQKPKPTAESLKQQVTERRWLVETGGITLQSGEVIATGIDDQNRITSVVTNAERAGLQEVDFKSATGWSRIRIEQVQAIAAAVAMHVQACFSAERMHHEAIDAIASQSDAQVVEKQLGAYDIASGWPGQKTQAFVT